MEDGELERAILGWLGVDNFVLRLLKLAWELRNNGEDAHEVFCRLKDCGHLSMKTAATMPKGGPARYYRLVTDDELILERARLAPLLMTLDVRLAEFVLRDCLSSVRINQPSTELFCADAGRLCENYRVLAALVRDCLGPEHEMAGELLAACEELAEKDNRIICVNAVRDELNRRKCG